MTLPLHLHPTAKHELNLSHSLRINDCLAVRFEFTHLEFICGTEAARSEMQRWHGNKISRYVTHRNSMGINKIQQ